MTATFVARHVPTHRLILIAHRTFLALILVSAVAAVALPQVGLTTRAVNYGTWRGILEHRNGLGYLVALGFIFFLASQIEHRPRWNLRFWAILGLYTLVLLKTGSKSSLVLCVLIALAWLALLATQTRKDPGESGGEHPSRVGFLLIAGAGAGLLAANFWLFIQFLGKRESLESRIEIWTGAWQSVQPVLWYGFGWSSILGSDDSAAQTISGYSGYLVRSVHNGYLAVLLQLGVIGSVLALSLLVRALWRAVRDVVSDFGPTTFMCAATLSTLMIGDLTESRAFVNIGWFLLAMIWELQRTNREKASH